MSKSFGKIMYDLRSEKNISISQMSNDLRDRGHSVSKSMISRWEKDQTVPTMENAKIIAEYFGVSLDYLLGRSEEKTTERSDPVEEEIRSIAAHATRKLTNEEIEEIRKFAEYIIQRDKK